MSGGRITTGTGELTLAADVDVFGVTSTINGHLALGGAARVITTHSPAQDIYALSINASISGVGGDGGLIKRGPGVLVLAGANAYGGFTRVEDGTLWAADPLALGIAAADAGTGVLAGGRIVLFDNIAGEPLLIEKGSATEHAVECSGQRRRNHGSVRFT